MPDPITFNEFFNAAYEGGDANLAKVELFIQQNNVNATNSKGESALTLAAYKDHTAIINALLTKPGININFRHHKGQTALLIAAWYGHDEIVTVLLAKAGIEINAASNHGSTALLLAAMIWSFFCCCCFISYGRNKCQCRRQ